MDEGYIKLNRSITKNMLWDSDEPFDKRSAWIDLLLMANWKDTKKLVNGKIVLFKQGTVYKSMLDLASRWKWHRTTVSRYLKLLESDNMIVVDATTHGTTITIVNWGFYQNGVSTKATTDATTVATTIEQPMRQPMHTIEEIKESKESKEGKNIPPYSPPKGKTTKRQKADHNVDLLDKVVSVYGFSEPLTEKLRDWMRYKGEERGDEYKETGMRALLTQTGKQIAVHGESAVMDCIDTSMANGWKGIVWDRLESKPKQQGVSFLDVMREEWSG